MTKPSHLALAAMLAACLPGTALAAPTGPAASAVNAYMRDTKVPCYTQAGEGQCRIAAIGSGTKVFYGKPDAATEQAVAFIDYQYDATGNAMDQMAVVFRNAGGKWIPVGRADNTVGSSPREVRFTPGEITYVGTVMGERDARANPTGRGTFRLVVDARGVTFAGKASSGPSMSKAIRR